MEVSKNEKPISHALTPTPAPFEPPRSWPKGAASPFLKRWVLRGFLGFVVALFGTYGLVAYLIGAEVTEQTDDMMNEISARYPGLVVHEWSRGMMTSYLRLTSPYLDASTQVLFRIKHSPYISGDSISLLRIQGKVNLAGKEAAAWQDFFLQRPRLQFSGEFFNDGTGILSLISAPLKMKPGRPFQANLPKGGQWYLRFDTFGKPSSMEMNLPKVLVSMPGWPLFQAHALKLRANATRSNENYLYIAEGQLHRLRLSMKEAKPKVIRRGTFRFTLGKISRELVRELTSAKKGTRLSDLFKVVARSKDLKAQLGLNIDFDEGKTTAHMSLDVPPLVDLGDPDKPLGKVDGRLGLRIPAQVLRSHASQWEKIFQRMQKEGFLKLRNDVYRAKGSFKKGVLELNGKAFPLDLL